MSANPYDPVTTTDSTQLADDDWGLNLPSIGYKDYGSSRCKSFCNFLRERSRLLIILGIILVVGIVLISIIAVATSSSSGRKPSKEDKAKSWSGKEEIVFYPAPEDGSTVISFSVRKSASLDSHILKSLAAATEPYLTQNQFNRTIFQECTANTHSPNKTCRLSNMHFGDVCDKHLGWGYKSAMPCILLQLSLPDNMVIKPISSSSPLWKVSQYIMGSHNDPSFVPVNCEGTTASDRFSLGFHGVDKLDPDPIQYYPADGFPAFFYRQRDLSKPFLKPAMMVRLTSLTDDHMISLTCTAFGQLYDFNDKMLDHKLLTTQFSIYMTP